MKLSIIIPAYNVENLVGKTLESVVNQDIRGGGYEIIVVNDGSKDNTLSVLKDWESKYPDLIRVIDKENGGVSSARNAGIEVAQGEWIYFCDADDYITEYSLGNLLEYAAKENTSVGLINFGLKNVDRQDVKTTLTYNVKRRSPAREFFLTDLFWCTWLFMFKRDTILKGGLHFQKVPACEDSLFNIEYILSMPKDDIVVKYDTKVYHYYNNPNSVTRHIVSNECVRFMQRFFPVFELYNQIIPKYHLQGAEYERMKWVIAKAFPNYFTRMLHSHINLREVRNERNRLIQVGAIPFNEVTTSPLYKSDRLKAFLLLHPLLFIAFRAIYNRIKGYK